MIRNRLRKAVCIATLACLVKLGSAFAVHKGELPTPHPLPSTQPSSEDKGAELKFAEYKNIIDHDLARSDRLVFVTLLFDGKQIHLHSHSKDIRVEALRKFSQSHIRELTPGAYFFALGDIITSEDLTPDLPTVLVYAAENRLVEKKKVVLIPDIDAQSDYYGLLPKIRKLRGYYGWSTKESKFFWRGSSTGRVDRDISSPHKEKTDRGALVHFSSEHPTLADAKFTKYVQFQNAEDEQRFASHFPLAPEVTPERSLTYRYLIDVDGNGPSYARMAWILSSDSVLVKKTSPFVQWYYRKLVPWVNYVPFEKTEDLKSIYTKLEAPDNHELIEKIIQNANELADDLFSEAGIGKAFLDALRFYQVGHEGEIHYEDDPTLSPLEKKYQKMRHNGTHVYVTLTTSPARLSKIRKALKGVPPEFIDGLILSIAKRFGRDGKKYPPSEIKKLKDEFPYLRILRSAVDIGPITKVLPTLRWALKNDPKSIVVSMDDDHRYPRGFLPTLALASYKHDAVITGSGQPIGFWHVDSKGWDRSPKAFREDGAEFFPVDVPEGFGGISYPVKLLNEQALDRAQQLVDENRDCKFSDDVVLGNMLNELGIARYRVVSPEFSLTHPGFKPMPYGYEEDALHRGAGLANAPIAQGEDYNFVKYQKAMDYISKFSNGKYGPSFKVLNPQSLPSPSPSPSPAH